jgi:hypothetical protein
LTRLVSKSLAIRVAKPLPLVPSCSAGWALSGALEMVRNDAVPGHLQRELIRSMEAAIARIEDEKSSIDMA